MDDTNIRYLPFKSKFYIGFPFAQLRLGCRWVDMLISLLTLTKYVFDNTFRRGTRGVDRRKYIWGALKPCGKLDFCS